MSVEVSRSPIWSRCRPSSRLTIALFSLFGSTGAGMTTLEAARWPTSDACSRTLSLRQARGRKVRAVRSGGLGLVPEGRPKPDIMLVREPHACWIVRVCDHLVFLLRTGMATRARHFRSGISRSWAVARRKLLSQRPGCFKSLEGSKAVPVHLGRCGQAPFPGRSCDSRQTLPGGKRLEGVCVSHVGEAAVLLCDR